MIHINPLIFLFIIEGSLVLVGVSFFLYRGYKRLSKKEKLLQKNRETLIGFFEKSIAECQDRVKGFKNLPEKERSSETWIEAGLASTRLRFLRASLNGLKDSADDTEGFWQGLYKGYNEIVQDIFSQLKKFTDKRAVDTKKYKEETKKLSDAVSQQKNKVAELLGRLDILNEIKDKFKTIQEANARLKQSITELIPEAERSKELEDALTNFEQNNKELNNCVGTLEKENEDLVNKVDYFGSEIARLTKAVEESVNKKKYESLLKEKNNISERVSKLEKELDEKTKAFDALQNNFNYIEKEYLALYEEHKGGQP